MAASNAVETDDIADAIDLLSALQAKCDGDRSPKDWVTAEEAAASFHEALSETVDLLWELLAQEEE